MAGQILCNVVRLYELILFVRVILSFIPLFRPGWSPSGGLRPVVDFVYGLTDPPLHYIRRFVPQPMGFPFDLAFTLWFVVIAFVVRPVVCSF
jgi:YggT family protein